MENKIGVSAFGLKTGAILPGDNLIERVYHSVKDMVDDRDIVCVTEAVVAISQSNYVSTKEVAQEIKDKLGLNKGDSIGVVFPITSRNRFVLVLKSIAEATEGGRVIVQLSYPDDEVGNPTIDAESISELECDRINPKDLKPFLHPFTGVDYIDLYRKTIEGAGAEADIFLSNDPKEIIKSDLKGIMVASIHNREKIKDKIKEDYSNCITLQDICSDRNKEVWSEWGLLGSNMADDKLKLAPREADQVALAIQSKIKEAGKNVEVIIYGDGAYKDPDTGIYELADPSTFFGLTPGLAQGIRKGIKYKLFVEKLHKQNKNRDEIESYIEQEKNKSREINSFESEGTTPRKLAHIVASLADLISGSADAGTPVVIVKGIL